MKTSLLMLALTATTLSAWACGRDEVELTRVSTSPSTNPAPATTAVNLVVSGTISAIDAAARTIVVDGKTVIVPASSRIDGGREGAVTFADLKVGWRVTIRATRQDSTITATDVVVEQRGAVRTEIDGRVAALSGACPALTFTIGATPVSTGAATVFSGQSCAQLANGVSVIVDGTRQDDGTINADHVFQRTGR